jgi:hypothetical protein
MSFMRSDLGLEVVEMEDMESLEVAKGSSLRATLLKNGLLLLPEKVLAAINQHQFEDREMWLGRTNDDQQCRAGRLPRQMVCQRSESGTPQEGRAQLRRSDERDAVSPRVPDQGPQHAHGPGTVVRLLISTHQI